MTVVVDELPRRTAHALHALLCAADDQHGPPTAAETCIFDDPEREPQSDLRSGSARGTVPCMASGQLRVRLPVDLHTALTAEAATQKVSLNTLIVALLAGGINFTLEES